MRPLSAVSLFTAASLIKYMHLWIGQINDERKNINILLELRWLLSAKEKSFVLLRFILIIRRGNFSQILLDSQLD